MTAAERSAERYARLKAEGRCVQCMEPRGPEDHRVRCNRCFAISNRGQAGGRLAAKSEALEAEVLYIIETAETLTPVEQAAKLGIVVDRVYGLRAIARRRGYKIPNIGTPRKEFAESGKWAELTREMSVTCERCGLRGPHECIPAIDGWERRGPGRSYPEPGGCGISQAERSRMVVIESKFIRFTNAKRDAMRSGR